MNDYLVSVLPSSESESILATNVRMEIGSAF
jgi:hypothetical protein